MVFAALFWLQSIRTLRGRRALVIRDTTSAGWSFSSCSASFFARSLVCSELVDRAQAEVSEERPEQQRHLAALHDGSGRTWIQVENQQVRVADGRISPHRRVQFQGRQVRRPDERGQIVDHAIIDPLLLPPLARH